MLDLGWTELLLVGVVALIVVGPKDLPGMFRALGRFTAKVRGMAREFQRAMEDAADQTGVKDVGKDLRDATNPRKMGMDAVKDAVGDLGKWSPERKADKSRSDKAASEKAASEKGKAAQGSTHAGGSETARLAAERAEAARQAQETAAEKAAARTAPEEARDPAPAPADDRLVEDPEQPEVKKDA